MNKAPSKRYANDFAKDLYHWFIRNGQSADRRRDRNGDEWYASYSNGEIRVFRMKDGYESAFIIIPKASWA